MRRDDKDAIKKKGPTAGWYKGGNSSCRRHIAAVHYSVYSSRCKELKVQESREAIPKKGWEDPISSFS